MSDKVCPAASRASVRLSLALHLVAFAVLPATLPTAFASDRSNRLIPRRHRLAGEGPRPARGGHHATDEEHGHEDASQLRGAADEAVWQHGGLAGAAPAVAAAGMVPLRLTASPPGERTHSVVRCVGEDFSDSAWVSRSCHYRNLCLDTRTSRWLVFPEQNASVSRDPVPAVSLGPINSMWFGASTTVHLDIEAKLRWRPDVLAGSSAEEFAAQEGLTVLRDVSGNVALPYHSLCGANVGHLLWDELLMWFQLARLFRLGDRQFNPLRVSLADPLWATCDWIREHSNGKDLPVTYFQRCLKNYERWLPAMLGPGVTAVREVSDASAFWQGVEVPAAADGVVDSGALVCFPDAAVGSAPLSDHCLQDHGSQPRYLASRSEALNGKDGLLARMRGEPDGLAAKAVQCNSGISSMLWEWRGAMMTKLGVADYAEAAAAWWGDVPPGIAVLVSTHSNALAYNPFQSLSAQLESRGVTVRPVRLDKMEPALQAAIVSHAAVFMTVAGGGSVSGAFLEDGAGIVLCYRDTGPGATGKLDWALWEQTGYVRVRWLLDDDCRQASQVALDTVMEQLAAAQHFLGGSRSRS
eukprot:jgi/Tetstr1/422784/TSEL_013580.t1